MFDLSGKVALVTGGNSGIGLAFARGIAQAGGDVVIWGRRAEQNEQAAVELRRFGRRVVTRQVDVSVEGAVATGMADAVEQMGRVDCVIANAGIATRQPSFLEMTTAAYHELLAINLHGAYFTLREGVRHMVERAEAGDPGGSLITCGSMAAVYGVPQFEHYAAAKGGLLAMTRAIAVEYGPYGIRANMVCPGDVPGSIGAGVLGAGASANPGRGLTGMAPIPRRGRPEDFEGIAVYLMSDASAWHTADNIVIDGGYAMRGTWTRAGEAATEIALRYSAPPSTGERFPPNA